VGQCTVPCHRLSEHHLLRRTKSRKDAPKSLDEVDPELLNTYEKLASRSRSGTVGRVAVDAVFDSVPWRQRSKKS